MYTSMQFKVAVITSYFSFAPWSNFIYWSPVEKKFLAPPYVVYCLNSAVMTPSMNVLQSGAWSFQLK